MAALKTAPTDAGFDVGLDGGDSAEAFLALVGRRRFELDDAALGSAATAPSPARGRSRLAEPGERILRPLSRPGARVPDRPAGHPGQRPAARPAARPGRRSTGRPHRLGSQPAGVRLRLTRRGRLACTVAALFTLVVGVAALSVGHASAGSPASSHVPQHVVVQPGDSLWAVAVRALPQEDPRDGVAAIEAANHLTSVSVVAGQVLRLP